MKTLLLFGLSALVALPACNISTDGLSEGNVVDSGYGAPDFAGPTGLDDAGNEPTFDGSPGAVPPPYAYAGCDVDSACTDGCAEDLDCGRPPPPPPVDCGDADAGVVPCASGEEVPELPPPTDASGGDVERFELNLPKGEVTRFRLGGRVGAFVARAQLRSEQGAVDARVVDAQGHVLGRTAPEGGLDASGFAFTLAPDTAATLELLARDADVTLTLELAPQAPPTSP